MVNLPLKLISSRKIRWETNMSETRANHLMSLTLDLQNFNGEVWSTKKEKGISLNQPISGLSIPKNLVEFTDILTSMHSLE